jgi:alanine racemase/UDP-N-acetylmuramoyl-tripeptide--D-alanyl-D-alanine ligase
LKYQVAFSDPTAIEGQAHHCFHYIIDLLNMLIKGAALCGTPEDIVKEQLRLFSPEPIRTEIWKAPNHVLYINEPLSAERRFSMDLIRKWAPHGRHYLIESEEELKRIEDQLRPHDAVVIRAPTKIYPADLPNNRCVINLAAIRENLISLQRKCGQNTRLMVMVKAFAYGMDDLQIARFLGTCGIDILGVSCMDEAIALRRAGVTQAIFVIHVPPYEVRKALEWDVEIGLSDEETLETIEKEAPKKPLKVHLHVDTGMKRFGVYPEQALDLARRIHRSPHVQFEGIMTHLACSDDPLQDTFTLEQIATLDRIIHTLKQEGIDPPWKHAANSGGLLRFDWPQYNMARIGLAAYGLYSSKASQTTPLRLSVSLQSRIVALNTCRKGESVSYGRQYRATKETETIAIIPIGYYDGLHRNYSGKGYTLIRGHKAPLVGNICMDFVMVNVTDIPDVCVGDSVLIFGEDDHGNLIPPEDVALSGNSIIHELISCLGPRIQRFFIVEEAQTTQLRELK